MRLLVNALVAVTVLGVLMGVLMYSRHTEQSEAKEALARDEVRRFQQQVNYQAALRQSDQADIKFPASIEPEWFQGDLPANPLLSPVHPWVQVAADSQKALLHPPDRTAVDSSVAQFWYNPYTGVVRARVPVTVSDARALELYNYVNDSALKSLFTER